MRSFVLIALVVLAGSALADERVFKLRDGRSIQGELVEETRSAYIVQVATGTVRLAKETVASIEAAPARKPAPKREDLGVAGALVMADRSPPPAPTKSALATPEEIAAASSVSRLVRLLDGVRGLPVAPADADWKKNRRESLRAGYEALARIGTTEAWEGLLRYVDQDPGDLALLPVSACQCLPARAVTPEVLSRIVDLMERRSPEDLGVFSTTLSKLTGKTLGTNVGAWKSYTRKLLQDTAR